MLKLFPPAPGLISAAGFSVMGPFENSPAIDGWVKSGWFIFSPVRDERMIQPSHASFVPAGTASVLCFDPAINGWAIFSELTHY